jgi:F420-0:gamma-glutamyl ligase
VIIDEVITIAENQIGDQEAVAAAVEALERQRVQGKAFLDKLVKVIKEEGKRRLRGQAGLDLAS